MKIKIAVVGIIGASLLVVPFLASGMDAAGSEYNNKIYALQEQIKALQAQLAALLEFKKDPMPTQSSACLSLKNNLVVGSTDATTEGEVSKLQCFLKSSGYFPEAKCTGFYGDLTAQAVVRFQKAHGMDFVTIKSGVGPMTRSKMTCGQKVAQCATYESKPAITSISPSSGPIGTTIEIQGCNFQGFESDKIVWFTNSKGEKGTLNGQMDAATRASNTVLRVTIPQKICQSDTSYSGLQCPLMDMTPGVYTVFSNSYGGNSNAVNFTVTAN